MGKIFHTITNQKNLKKVVFFLIGLIFLTVALGYFYYQKNIFGQDRLRFEISAPENIEAGEEVEYLLRYRNNSDVRLEEMVLIFEYPERSITIEPEEMSEEVKKRGEYRREVDVGELNPGQEKTISFRARPLGKEGDSVKASASIRYVPKNLAARFEAKREHTAVIESVPIDLSFQIPSTVDFNRETSYRLRFSSEIDYPLTDLEIRINYPSGFRFVRGTPQTDTERRSEWIWPVLNKGDHGTIDVDGVLEGNPGDAKIFNAVLGVWKDDRFIVLKETSKGTSLSRSALLVDISVNGEDDYIADPGELLHYEVFFRNIGEETLEELFLLVDLDEDTLNFNQIETTDGRFQEDRGVLIWSYTFDFTLQSLRKNEDGMVEFWARVREDLPHEPKIKVTASMERAEKKVETKVNTRLALEQSVIREGSPFDTFGPFPFKQNEESSYTVRWNVKNYFNSVRDISVKAILPRGARVTGGKYPEDEGSLSFNSSRREVLLELEELSPGEEKEIIFEVKINPLSDFRQEDEVISKAEVTAEDKRTNNTITAISKAVFLDEIVERYNAGE